MNWTDAIRLATHGAAHGGGVDFGGDTFPFRLVTRHEAATSLRRVIGRARQALLALQQPSGQFVGRDPGDALRQSSCILLEAFLGRDDRARVRGAARRLLELQQADGGWSRELGGPFDLSATVLAYFALKFAGHDSASEPLACARRAILACGGASDTNGVTRSWLALFGQIPYAAAQLGLTGESDPSDDATLLARWVVAAIGVRRALPPAISVRELFLTPPETWSPPCDQSNLHAPREAGITRSIMGTVRRRLTFFRQSMTGRRRQRAIRAAHDRLLARLQIWQAAGDHVGVSWDEAAWTVIALESLGYTADTAPRRAAERWLEEMLHTDDELVRVQTSIRLSTDTAAALEALLASGLGLEHATVRRASACLSACSSDTPAAAVRWLAGLAALDAEGTPDHESLPPQLQVCEDELDEADDGADQNGDSESFNQLRVQRHTLVEQSVQRLIDSQRTDGGWTNDPSTSRSAAKASSSVSLTADALLVLSRTNQPVSETAKSRAVAFLRARQHSDGSWRARESAVGDVEQGAIESTVHVVMALAAAGVDSDDSAVAAGVHWFVAHQQPGGGWGELSPGHSAYIAGEGSVTARHTALAVLGLLAAGGKTAEVASRGVQVLLAMQQRDGSWDNGLDETATHLSHNASPLAIATPLLALCRWAVRGCDRQSREVPALRIAPFDDEVSRHDQEAQRPSIMTSHGLQPVHATITSDAGEAVSDDPRKILPLRPVPEWVRLGIY